MILGALTARYAISTGAFGVEWANIIWRMIVVIEMIVDSGVKIAIPRTRIISFSLSVIISRGSGWWFMGLSSIGSK